MTSTTTQDLRNQYPEVSGAHPDDAEFQAAVDRHRTAMKEQFGTFVEDKGLVDLIAAQPDFAGFYDEAGPDAGEVNLHDFVNEAEAALAAAQGRVNALRRRVDAEQDFTVGALISRRVRGRPCRLRRSAWQRPTGPHPTGTRSSSWSRPRRWRCTIRGLRSGPEPRACPTRVAELR